MRSITDWTRRLVSGESGRRSLALASFLESTIVPVPLETLVAPLMAVHPERAYRVAGAILAGCLAGALLFYLLASWLYAPVVAPALETLGLSDAFAEARARMDGANFFWAVFAVSLTPVPFQLATLGAGAAGGPVLVFMAAVAASRAIRYYGLAWLARRFGPQVVAFAGGRRKLLIGGAAALLGLYALYAIFAGG